MNQFVFAVAGLKNDNTFLNRHRYFLYRKQLATIRLEKTGGIKKRVKEKMIMLMAFHFAGS